VREQPHAWRPSPRPSPGGRGSTDRRRRNGSVRRHFYRPAPWAVGAGWSCTENEELTALKPIVRLLCQADQGALRDRAGCGRSGRDVFAELGSPELRCRHDADRTLYLTIREAGRLLQSRQLSPVRVNARVSQPHRATRRKVAVIHYVPPPIAPCRGTSREAEILRALSRPATRHPHRLEGSVTIPRAFRTTASFQGHGQPCPSEDATTTARLVAAGSILLGKLAMHEFALGGPDPTCGFLWHVIRGTSSTSPAARASAPGGRRGRTHAGLSGFLHRAPRSGASLPCSIVGLNPRMDGQPLWCGATQLDAGPLWTDDLDRRRTPHHVAGHCRLRSQRSHLQPRTGPDMRHRSSKM